LALGPIVKLELLTPAALHGFFLENRNQSEQHHKDNEDRPSQEEVIHRSLKVEDHVGRKDELVCGS